MNIFVICAIQAVVCSSTNYSDCTNIKKHGQMKGLLLAEKKSVYIVDFSEAATYKNFEGDYTNVTIVKSSCQKFKPKAQDE